MKLIHVLAGALALACLAAPAHAQVVAPSALEWAVAQGATRAQNAQVRPRVSASLAPLDIRTPVQRLIAQEVAARIGPQWIGTALRIARIESGFNCRARNRRAVGVFQNTDPVRFGVSRAAALTCAGGVRAGVSHMAMCIGRGARDAAQMMRCHNSGSPWGRVEHAYRTALRG